MNAHHNEGPFDAIRLVYVIVRNDVNTAEIFENIHGFLTANLDVTPIYNRQPVDDYNNIRKTVNETIQYCRSELKVEPGSDEALQLEW